MSARPTRQPEANELEVVWWPPSRLRPHDQAACVPELAAADYRTVRDNIAARGILVPLEATAAGVLLDGRARLRAAHELGLTGVPVQVIAVADEVEHMVLAALLRRQLSASQRAALVLDLDAYRHAAADADTRRRANLRPTAEVAILPPPTGKTRELAAGWSGASARTIQDAATVRQHDPELFEQIKAGRVAAHLAARRVRRRLRDTAIPDPGPVPDGPFELVYADPPWQLGSPDGPYAPENHYPTQPTDQIAALKPPVSDDAILYLWAVNSLLPDALHVMQAWGFEYKTNLVWVKPSIRLGIWARNRHELLLIGRRGTFPPPEPEQRADSVIEAPCRAHSQKPDPVYQLLERAHPRARKLELYARGTPKPGWAAWGNEVQP